MLLVERNGFLDLLTTTLAKVAAGEGHCVFVSGEAGIGKTSLVKTFSRELKKDCAVYLGTCDALFTPRPLAPLYDIIWQLKSDGWKNSTGMEERTELFAWFFHELSQQQEKIVIVFEDIHWADEATLDFVKFFARRITQLRCLFILTYRENEIHASHQLRSVLGQLPPDTFTRMQLPPLSRQAVDTMAAAKGFNGQEVYSVSGGNPFYVTEILASYSPGVPENIKDAVLSVYNRQDEQTKQVWELLSVVPAGLDKQEIEQAEPLYTTAIERCLDSAILVLKDGLLFFKHELYRRTIETALSPFKRVQLNKKMLNLFRENFERHNQIEKIIHHAKNANEYDLVVHYAPLAAKQAAAVGAHTEACRLYLSSIEYYQGTDKDTLVQLYESYAYECYLTNRMKDGIIYTAKALQVWKEKNNVEKTGNSLRFLSRLWWFEGNRKNAETFAVQAVEALEQQPASRAKAMAFSNMSQLLMLSKETEGCLFWGNKAIALAQELQDDEILSHALNNVGSVQVKVPSDKQHGLDLLNQSLEIALKNGYHEHAARAYTNLGSMSIVLKDYVFAKKALDEGIHYCMETDLDSWTSYMLSWRARLQLETGKWEDAYTIATNLLKNEDQPSVIKINTLAIVATLQMRRGDAGALTMLAEAKSKAFEAFELQRIIPAVVALLEYEWINGKSSLDAATINETIAMVSDSNTYETSELAFWLWKARGQTLQLKELHEGYDISSKSRALKAAALWKELGCPYQEALALFEGNDDHKREAIRIVQQLGANAVYEKLKHDMRASGIKSIPRGIRKSTQANAALLTDRELDVLQLLQEGLQNKEIASRLFISAKTVDHHISSLLFKLEVNSRTKAVQAARRLQIIK